MEFILTFALLTSSPNQTHYPNAKYTQDIAVLNNQDRISRVPRTNLEAKWQVSGGMVNIDRKLWRSEKTKYIPRGKQVKSWLGTIQVKNSFGYYQSNLGILREYPNGTRFEDILINSSSGKVFEHRVREKSKGKWISFIALENVDERPKGYNGLSKLETCSSCHNQAGTGGYATGLIPGGDTVISDELDWSIVSPFLRRAENIPLAK